MGFIELGLNEVLAEKLAASGIAEPSEVQKQALPALIEGKDGVIVSPTGTGKTLAYLLPLLQKIDGTRKETQALVLAPTQELAMQIMREAEAYGQPLGIKATALIGGASLARQLERMKGKPALIVGTPGRVREVASTRKLNLHAVSFVVVDETDRIFSLGGKSDVENLLKQCSRDRQTVFVSATRSQAMKEAENKWQRDPWVSDVTEKENENGLSSTLQHWYFLTDRREKIDLIRRIVRHMKPSSALLFVNDTEKIGELLAKLRFEGVSVDALYGDTRGQERGEVMQRFRQGRTKLLIATDVAARGLDLPGLPLVIQYEPALDADHYVHRSGRTARMGREGTSITLIAPEERFIIDKLEKQLKIEIQPRTLYEGKVVTLEESDAKRGQALERKPKLEWKSKAEYLASLQPESPKAPSTSSAEASKTPRNTSGTRSDTRRDSRSVSPSTERAPRTEGKSVPKTTAQTSSRPSSQAPARTTTRPSAKSSVNPPSANADARPLTAGSPAKPSAKAATRTVKPDGKSASDTEAQTQAKPQTKPVASAKSAKPAKTKTDRARDQKNKGAPKWLKEKRESATSPSDPKQ
ncbi:DEAD/DEAH box helicase [Cohnella endophytica]|uniref:DEAD/DEAH box helicase n=1 Tax=Cohnella endophytica TaxID=2419778 RepID=A0A494Y0A8_9BACL|nr:DEAD/DEAH box helicase [Cohnella endophytica]RKP56197.1 DEAD/DEAH box helicase [Cohnella endophytica]